MPKKDGSGGKGDLYIKFNIQFPDRFKPEIKEEIVNILKVSTCQ